MIGRPRIIASRMYGELTGRANGIARAESVTGHGYRTIGVLEMIGHGELDVDVTFPVRYTELPSVSGSGFLGEDEILVAGSYPTWNPGFAEFYFDERPGGVRLYKGGRLIVVSTGPSDRVATMHSYACWQVEGNALVNPGTTRTTML